MSATIRVFRAVSLPAVSQAIVYSIVMGWRLGWMRIDSSRLRVIFTGAPTILASRAVCT